jgi:hypothetical protein
MRCQPLHLTISKLPHAQRCILCRCGNLTYAGSFLEAQCSIGLAAIGAALLQAGCSSVLHPVVRTLTEELAISTVNFAEKKKQFCRLKWTPQLDLRTSSYSHLTNSTLKHGIKTGHVANIRHTGLVVCLTITIEKAKLMLQSVCRTWLQTSSP